MSCRVVGLSHSGSAPRLAAERSGVSARTGKKKAIHDHELIKPVVQWKRAENASKPCAKAQHLRWRRFLDLHQVGHKAKSFFGRLTTSGSILVPMT